MSSSDAMRAGLALAARDLFAPPAAASLWRGLQGALRVDSAPSGQASRFVRLALPGDVIGVEQWAGTHDCLSLRALIDTRLAPVQAEGTAMMQILMETVVVAHQRCREVVTLRSGPVAQRLQALLLLFAQAQAVGGAQGSVADCPVPFLADLSEIVDAAPETVSRVLGSMRAHDFLQDRKPQKARFSSQALQGLEMVAGMSAVRPARRLAGGLT